MKIVYVSDTYYPYFKGGKEKRLYELTTRLSASGHDVHVYTMHWWDAPGSQITTDQGVTLHAISKLYPLYKGDRRSIAEGLMYGIACLKLLRVKWDVLDVDHMPFFPVYSAWLVCLLTGRHRTFHGTWHEALSRKDWTDYMGPAGNIAAVIERVSVKLPYAISAASAHTARLLRSTLHRSRGVSIIASGVDTALIAKAVPAAHTCDVLYTGRLVKDKNIDKLVAAIRVAAVSKPDLRCIIIGHGIEKEHLSRQIAAAGLGAHITMLDPLPQASDVYGYMKSAKVFCLPSVREGFGIVALEALACGTPVITTDAPANAAKDLITSADMGAVLPLNPASFAEAILAVVNKPKPAGLARRMQQYDWDSVARAQAEVYGV